MENNVFCRIITDDNEIYECLKDVTISDRLSVDGLFQVEMLTAESYKLADSNHLVVVATKTLSQTIYDYIRYAKDHGLLTLVLSSEVRGEAIVWDALSVMPVSRFYRSVQVILEWFLGLTWICIDFNDIKTIFMDAGFFRIYEAQDTDIIKIVENLEGKVCKKGVTRALTNIAWNANSKYKMGIVRPVSDFLESLNEEVDNLWFISLTDRIALKEIRVTVTTTSNTPC